MIWPMASSHIMTSKKPRTGANTCIPFETKINRMVPMETSSIRAMNISSGRMTQVNNSELKKPCCMIRHSSNCEDKLIGPRSFQSFLYKIHSFSISLSAMRLLGFLFPGILALGQPACSAQSEGELPPFSRCQAPEPADGDLVRVEGGAFMSGDFEIMPHGINSYPLLQHVGDNRVDRVRDILAQARSLGRPIVRTNAFMDGGDNPARLRDGDGTLREEGFAALDRVLYEASIADVRLVLILTNNWSDYGGAAAVVEMAAPGEGLPKDAFWSEARAVAAQVEFVRTLVARTNSLTGRRCGEDPTVLAWELANEARCDDPVWCDGDTLAAWAKVMSQAVRQAGGRQPIFWGGAGAMGEHGEDMRRLAAFGGIDVLTLHIYLDSSVFALNPEEERVRLAARFGAAIIEDRAAAAEELGMPLVVEELGWKPLAEDRDAERAAVYEGWLAMAHDLGLATAPWMIGEQGREDFDGLLIRPTDTRTWEVISCR
jgi:mannan endo-1,4-beta-mannosidase